MKLAELLKTATKGELEMKTKKLIEKIEGLKVRSAWDKGVKEYALELLEDYSNNEDEIFKSPYCRKCILNGADDWSQYSYGGCSLIYDEDIAERLCNPSELKKTKNGSNPPNQRETWLECQARALYQASNFIFRNIEETEE